MTGADALVQFARARHRLATTEQLAGDERMVEAERRTTTCIWALRVLTHVLRGEVDTACALAACGPPRIAMERSSNVEYARGRHRHSGSTGDSSFLLIQSLTDSHVRVIEAILRSLESWIAAASESWTSKKTIHA